MSEQSTARLALRVLITGLAPPDIRSDALELLDIVAGAQVLTPRVTPVDPARMAVASDAALSTLSTPLPTILPGWLPVVHSKGPQACNRPAYYVTKRLHPRKKPDIKTIRLMSTQAPPRPGIDQQVCGSCSAILNPFFSLDMLDLDAVFLTPAEIYLEEQRLLPDDPNLLAQNQASRRWEVDETSSSNTEALIGLAQQHVTAETLLLERNNGFSGLPPDSDVPTLDELPDPREIDYLPEEPDGPESPISNPKI